MSTIQKLFGKSPFNAFYEHMCISKSCAEKVIPLVEAFIAGDKNKYIDISREIVDLETKADYIKNELRDNLPRSLFMPVNRHDLLARFRGMA